MEQQQWADAVCLILQQYQGIPPLSGDDWQSWGTSIVSNPQLGKFGPPDPYRFDDFKDWAEKVAAALQSATESPGRYV